MSIDAASLRLGVSVAALRLSTDVDDPHPAIEVLDALVREEGVDPTWLLTGDYDFAAHQRAIEGLGEFAASPIAPLLGPDGGSADSSDAAVSHAIPLIPLADRPPAPVMLDSSARPKDVPSSPESVANREVL